MAKEKWTPQKLKEIFETTSDNKALVFPLKLKNYINEDADFASFVKFTPKASKFKIPTLEDIKKNENSSSKSEAGKVEEVPVSVPLDCIILPIRPTVDTLTANWQGVEGAGALAGGWTNYLTWKGAKALSGIASTILPQELVLAYKAGFLGSAIDNPHEKLLFAGHERRTFDIAWEFLKPESEEDEKVLSDIISIFRKTSVGTYETLVIGPPPTWEIEFYSFPMTDPYLIYEKCGVSASVGFGGDGNEFKAMESGMPFMSLSLSITELDYPTEKILGVNSKKSTTKTKKNVEIEPIDKKALEEFNGKS